MNFVEMENEKEQFEQQSREAGKTAFNQIAERLRYWNLYWMSRLEKEERTWENLLKCTRTEAQDWKDAAREYDHDSFASGFFERFDEAWKKFEVWYTRLCE